MSKNYLLGFSILFLAACGGSGAGPTGSSGPGATNSAPVISSGNTYSVAENTTAIGSVSATDADGDSLTYILQGDDSSLVSLTGTTLAFKAAPDFEAPGDANSDNVYEVTIVVSDGSAKDAKDLSITVTNVNEGPQLLAQSAYTVEENNATVTTITVSDASGDVTFSLSGTDSAAMTIGASTGVLAFAANPDFEAPADADADNVYNVTVTAADSAGSNSADVAVTVTDVVECTGACDLFISEAAEGSSFNKYFEIANFTGAEVALVDYAFANVSNAVSVVGEHEYWNPIWDASNTVADGDVHVVCHPSADEKILARCDTEFSFFGNGDDGFKLVKGEESNYTVIDTVGDFQGRPSGGWDVCGVEAATKDHTLVKKEGKEGNDDWTDSRGTDANDCDWIVAENDAFISPTNSWDGLGSHCYDSSKNAVTFSSASTFSVVENTTAVGTIAASAAGCISGETVTYTLSGADKDLFTIDAAGVLAFVSAPDFETTGSASGTNDYTVVVTATAGTTTANATLTVSVVDDGGVALFTGQFGNMAIDGDTFTFPAGAESWGGYSNDNTDLYPLSFPNGGTITFTGSAVSDDVNVRFRFEKNPFPDVDPAYDTAAVTVSGSTEATYTIDVPTQGENTFRSFLMYLNERDLGVVVKNVTVTQKAAEPEGVVPDFKGTFNGTVFDAETNTYTFPSTAADFAGFSNDNTDFYPLSFSEDGKVKFNGSAPDGDVVVRFRFEANPYPNVDPAYDTETVTVSGADVKAYEVNVPSQGDKTFNSALMYLNTRDIGVVLTDIRIIADTPDPEACGNRGEALTGGKGGGLADFCEAFAGTTYDDDTKTYGYPTGAESYAGFANKDTSIYPIKLGGGATITFDASAPGADTTVKFKFEKDPYPNNNPEFFTDLVTISGATEKQYSVTVPVQDASVDWNSFLFYLVTQDTTVVVKNINVVPN